MKPILPSLKQKKRYIVFEIVSKSKIRDIHAVSEAISQKLCSFMGTFGAGKAGVIVLNNYDTTKQRGIIKVSNKAVHQVKSALMMITKIGRKKAIVRSVGVSGILKKAKQKCIA